MKKAGVFGIIAPPSPPAQDLQVELGFEYDTVLYREDAGTVNITLGLSGPRLNETTIRIAIMEISSTVEGKYKVKAEVLSLKFKTGDTDFISCSW